MRADCILLAVLICCVSCVLTASVKNNVDGVTLHNLDILMRGAKPSEPDAYLCSSYKVNEDEAYIVKFEALADADTAHHILLYGCEDEGFGVGDVWGCPPVCRGRPQIMFAWAKNAPPTQLPDGVGVRIGRKTSIRTIVLQIHYAKSFQAIEEPDKSGIRLHISKEKQPYVAGIFLMLSTNFRIPENQPKYHVDVSCQYRRPSSMFPIAYRTHAHGLGRVITGYQHNMSGYHLIGKGNPQWPQAFYPSNASIEIKPGDQLVARCTYDSTGTDHTVFVGGTNNDEMCNFYIMFYTDASVQNPYGECSGVELSQLVDNLPEDSDVTLPPNPLLDAAAHGHHHHHHHPPPPVDADQPFPSSAVVSHHDHTGNLQSQDRYQDISHQQKWSHLPHTGSSPQRDALLHYLTHILHNNEIPPEDDMNRLSVSEEELPAFLDKQQEELDSLNVQKRMGGEYYDDYAANDEREQGTFQDANPGLSRNRNKAFEAMNQELKGFQHIKPHGEGVAGDAGYWSQQRYPQTMSRKKVGNIPRVPSDQGLGGRQPVEPIPGKLVFQSDWPSQQMELGQVGGVATDSKGNVYIFHRGSRVWDRDSFDFDDNFQHQDTPIMEDVVVILSREGKLIRKFGSGQYYMPHGITVDDHGNIWLTDVALHQVFKILPGESTPNMTLGMRFAHGDDAAHFCKPTDVAVLSSGDFYVSDGYCNTRVMKFSKSGVLTKTWGQPNSYSDRIEPRPNMFFVPHSITVAEEMGLVCVADRENGRIQCFDLEGNFRFIVQKPEFGPRLFAVEYCPKHGGLLYAVNGPSFDGNPVTVKGFTISLPTNTLVETWNVPSGQGLQNPHDVAVDINGHAVYVGELNPTTVWKFQRQVPSSSTVPASTQKTAPATPHPTAHSADKENTTAAPSAKADSEEKLPAARQDKGANKVVTGGLVKESKMEKESELSSSSSDFTPSIIIGVLLIVPVVLLLVITLIMRWHHRGWASCFSGMGRSSSRVFNFKHLLGNSHRGFDKLSQEDSDHDADVLSDSDNEEFRQPMKSKA
ncbi:peptidyl-glycine alpha-amidating monooxygenase B-like isoform X1 [Babylonia areolata]|uniref:peptidyl-glycine alpha-amidating monooxygenase B-like isoform X1 n=1 Tax=Babylonia areolata TaxID=304850 RepID=UPI003FD1726B